MACLLALAAVVAIFAVAFKLPETVVAPFELVPAEAADRARRTTAEELRKLGFRITPPEDVDERLRGIGISQGGQLGTGRSR